MRFYYDSKVSKEETRKVQVLHNNLLQTLVSKREEVTSTEESLKTTADALKKQVKDEAHARTVLQVSGTLVDLGHLPIIT